MKWKSSMDLPAITICSTNFINYTLLKSDLASKDETGLDEQFKKLLLDVAKLKETRDIKKNNKLHGI